MIVEVHVDKVVVILNFYYMAVEISIDVEILIQNMFFVFFIVG
jgi:hypothetical protein